MDRQIVHIDQDAFFVSVELLKNPALIGKAVIVGGSAERGVVTSCSYEARKFGVRSAMPSKLAARLCPHAIFVRGNMADYSKYSHMVTDILRERVPALEKASIDEHYIDLTGMDRFHNTMKFASELRRHVMKETGLPLSFGLSVNKTLAKMATNECKPSGELQIRRSEAQAFLNPLSIQKIPGLGKSAYARLSERGIVLIGQLAKISPDELLGFFGQNGIDLWKKANGIYDSPFAPYRERKSIGTQSTFHTDSFDTKGVKELLTSMVMELTYQLRSQKKLTSCITVTIRYSGFETHTQQLKIPYTSLDSLLIDRAKELFDKVYQPKEPLRLVGVRLSGLISGHEQIGLFSSSEERYKLYQALDNIRDRFGEKSVKLASTMNIRL
ncbi:DNA polymerase IV [Daejeonella sp. JGW-45]|uniref:DNA polymerase IV n=1 Tax=Daejeonella sp. JGW-45 TaxID=3034148 RepID=UPI0023ED046D|nr:DNA polymerase IV [Daejeonella sp. JGW-45]